MAIITSRSELAKDVYVEFKYDDSMMKLLSISYCHNSESQKKLRINMLSPYSKSFIIVDAGTGLISFTIPSGIRPSYTLETVVGKVEKQMTGITWQATYGG